MEEPEQIDSPTLADRASAIIPGGTSTGSKQPRALFGEEIPLELPTHYLSASGCEVTLPGGRTIVDCTMALGAVAIGYADEMIGTAVMQAVGAGNVCGLPPVLEIDVAERLSQVIPCAESVRFLKTGAEATAAAVRIARAATGRDHVIGCGYFGWLDWCSQQPGVPRGVQSDFSSVAFNDADALSARAREVGKGLAAIILEPVIEDLPSERWIALARSLCDELGAVLIFDEVKTGFRLRTAGYQEFSGVVPDLAVFGKAMANGFPISALTGKESIMDAARGTWISSTLACETSALAAVGAVLDWHERAEVCESLWSIGAEIRQAVGRAIESSGIAGVELGGIDPMWFLRFDEPARESRFVSLALDGGVLFKRGAYNFSSLSHDEPAVRLIERACSTALVGLLEEERQAAQESGGAGEWR